MIDIRRDLHQHPGVSGCEHYAHDLIVRELQPLHPARLHTHVGGFGVVAYWGDNDDEAVIAFRADIDALPSGHRCGHDGHTAILLALAHRVAACRPAHVGCLLLFQPQEETGCGAQAVIDSGVLRQYDIRAFYGLHNLPGFPLGAIVLNRTTFAAASSGVLYRLQGRTTHASTPEKGLNPGLAVAELVQQFDQLNVPASLPLETFRQSTLIGARVGSDAFGTSAGDAEVMFTLRAFTNRSMDRLLSDADVAARRIADKYHLLLSSDRRDPFPATENTPALVDRLALVADTPLIVDVPFRWSEDFANYLLLYPGCFFGIGAGENHLELHHPHYDFPDEIIAPAADFFYKILSLSIY